MTSKKPISVKELDGSAIEMLPHEAKCHDLNCVGYSRSKIPSREYQHGLGRMTSIKKSSKHSRKRILRNGCTAETKKLVTTRYWTDEEHERFISGINKHGHKNFSAISGMIGTRGRTQTRTHAQKFYIRVVRHVKKLALERDEVSGVPIDKAERSGNNLINDMTRNHTVPAPLGLLLLSTVSTDIMRKSSEISDRREEISGQAAP